MPLLKTQKQQKSTCVSAFLSCESQVLFIVLSVSKPMQMSKQIFIIHFTSASNHILMRRHSIPAFFTTQHLNQVLRRQCCHILCRFLCMRPGMRRSKDIVISKQRRILSGRLCLECIQTKTAKLYLTQLPLWQQPRQRFRLLTH